MTSWWKDLWRSKLLWSYFIDLVLIGLIFLPYPFVVTRKPYEQKVWLDDRSIQYPFQARDHIPSWTLPFISLGIPAAIMLMWLAWKRFEDRRLLIAFIGLLLTLALTVIITNILKVLVGELRPDYLSRCDPDPLITDRIVCRGNPKYITEGKKSFPSGHTSSCFGGLGYLSLFLAGQLGLYDGTGYVYRFLLVSAPLLGATYVGVTRILDYRHHWHDVLSGALLGMGLAYLCYRLYFPPVMKLGSEIPYDRRWQLFNEDEEHENSQSITNSTNYLHSGPSQSTSRRKNHPAKSVSFSEDSV